MESEYLTLNEIAAKLRVSHEAVRNWCRTGRLKHSRAGRLYRVLPKDLEAFLKQEQEKPGEPKKTNGLVAFAI
jgi:excisionase family DNA binding protein